MYQPPQYLNQPPQQPTIIIHNNNANTNVNANNVGSSRSGWATAYLWMFGLGFLTFGMTWLVIPVLAIIHLCVYLASDRTITPVLPRVQPQQPVSSYQLAGEIERAYVIRVLDLALHGGYLSMDDYTSRAFEVPTAKLIGDLDKLMWDVPVAIRQTAYYQR